MQPLPAAVQHAPAMGLRRGTLLLDALPRGSLAGQQGVEMTTTRALRDWQDGDGPRAEDGTPTVEAPVHILQAPLRASVTLTCPVCGMSTAVVASLFARVTRDSDGTSALALRTRAPKSAHSCDQMTLEGATTGALVR
jgi:hypothetical protein